MCRSPATASPAEDPKLRSSATRTAGVHFSGRRITGSASCPRTAAMPMPVQRRAGQRGLFVPPAFLAAIKAAKGIGQGAAMPAPHPTTSPAGTESGSLRPSASVESCSRTATALPNPTAPANPSAATRSAVFSFTPAMTSRVTKGVRRTFPAKNSAVTADAVQRHGRDQGRRPGRTQPVARLGARRSRTHRQKQASHHALASGIPLHDPGEPRAGRCVQRPALVRVGP